jgi:pyruvate kinase
LQICKVTDHTHDVYFDDGKVQCIAVARHADAVELRVVRSSSAHPKIKGDAGINVPDTTLSRFQPSRPTI